MFEKLAILGSGAIGSVIGGYLARAGNDVTFIDAWAAHVEAMRQNGLKISAPDEEFTVPVNAVHLGEVCNISDPFDAVVLSVKSYDTVWAVHCILPYLKATGLIISSQNAINDELIAPIVGFSRSIACVVTLGGASLYEPGHAVRASVPAGPAFKVGELSGLPTARARRLADILGVVGPTDVTTNVWGERWAKLATNSMANPICAVTGLGSAGATRTPGVVDIMIKAAVEVVQVGTALGVQVEPINGVPAETYARANDGEALEELRSRLDFGDGRPSMLQDVLKGRRTEIEYLNGYVAARGREAGVATPLCEAITQLVKQVERGEIKPDVANIKPLERYL